MTLLIWNIAFLIYNIVLVSKRYKTNDKGYMIFHAIFIGIHGTALTTEIIKLLN